MKDIYNNDIAFHEKHFGENYYTETSYWAGRLIDLGKDMSWDAAEEIVNTIKHHSNKIMKENENSKTLALVEELKTAKYQGEILQIETYKDELDWMKVDGVIQDLFSETLGDAKKGLYF